MITVQNKFSDLILAKGFAAVTVWPFIFVRTDVAVSRQLLTHERIHGRQQLGIPHIVDERDIQALPSGTVFADIGQEYAGFYILRIKG